MLVENLVRSNESLRPTLVAAFLPPCAITSGAFTKFPNPSKPQPQGTKGIDKRFQQLPQDDAGSRSIFSYRHSIDASFFGDSDKKQDTLGIAASPELGNMVLIIDPFHASTTVRNSHLGFGPLS